MVPSLAVSFPLSLSWLVPVRSCYKRLEGVSAIAVSVIQVNQYSHTLFTNVFARLFDLIVHDMHDGLCASIGCNLVVDVNDELTREMHRPDESSPVMTVKPEVVTLQLAILCILQSSIPIADCHLPIS